MERAKKFLLLNTNTNRRSSLSEATYTDINTNICNSYIAYALCKMLGLAREQVIEIVNICHFEKSEAFSEAAEKADYIILILQDQLRSDNADEWYEHARKAIGALSKTQANLICLSLAANSLSGYDEKLHIRLSSAKRAFFDQLAGRALSIGVRGEYTALVLERLGIRNFFIAGCPSYFETGPARTILPPSGSELAAKDAAITGALRLRHEPNVRYYLQGDFEWPIIELLCRSAESDEYPPQDGLVPTGSIHQGPLTAAMQGRCHFFTDFERWKRHLAKHCCLAVGTRLHGAILASNAGLPAIVTNQDARARESCEYLGITWLPLRRGFVPKLERADLYKRCAIDKQNLKYGALYQRFAGWMAGLGLPLVENAESLKVNEDLERPSESRICRRILSLYPGQSTEPSPKNFRMQ